MKGERCNGSMKGTKSQEGVVFKMVRGVSIIFGRRKKANHWRWLMNYRRDEITDEKRVLEKVGWH